MRGDSSELDGLRSPNTRDARRGAESEVTTTGAQGETSTGGAPVRRRSTAWAWALLVVLVTVSLVTWLVVRNNLEHAASNRFDDEADGIVAGLGETLQPYADVVQQLGDLSSDHRMTRDEFQQFYDQQDVVDRLPATYAFVVTEHVDAGDTEHLDELRALVESVPQPAGFDEPATLQPDPLQDEHEFIIHAGPEQLRYNALGLDGSFLLSGVEASTDFSGEPRMLDAVPFAYIEAIPGRDVLEGAPDPWLAIIGMPYSRDGEELSGFAAVVVYLQDAIETAVTAGRGIGLDVAGDTLQVEAGAALLLLGPREGGVARLAEVPVGADAGAVPGGFVRAETDDVLGQEWRLRLLELPTFGRESTSEQWIWLAAGLLISVLLFALVLAQLRARGRALDMVDTATSELRTTADQLRDSEERFRNAFEDEKKLAERLQEADRLKAEFLSMASHELRTPLTAAAAFVDTVLLQWDRLDDEKRKELLARASGNAKELTRLIEQLLASVRLDDEQMAVAPSPQMLDTLVEDVTRRIAPLLTEHTVEVDVPEGIEVMADQEAFRHVLTNLLTNAVKYSDPGTTITMSAVPADDEVEFHVRDHGAGIAPDDLERIFERFYQAGTTAGSRRGMGVGLTIVRRYVELQGGRIWVDSQVGEGSTFSFTIPLAAHDGRGAAKGSGPRDTGAAPTRR